MNKFAFILLAFVSLLITKNVYADTNIECFNCNNYQSMAEQTFISSGLSSDWITVVDLHKTKIKRYYAILINEPGYDYVSLTEHPVPTQTLQDFQTVVSARNSVKTAMQTAGDFQVPGELAESAFDLVGNHLLQSSLVDAYNNSMTWDVQIANYMALSAALFGKVLNVNLVASFVFPDGSIAVFNLAGVNSNGKVLFTFASAKDIDGNIIPLSASAYYGAYFDFTSANFAKFYNNAITLHNITFGVINVGYRVKVTCSITQQGTKCTQMP